MIFGDHLEPAATVEPAAWIGPARHGAPWTVGGLVPNDYRSVLRVFAPASNEEEDWWSRYRDLFEVVASVGERHTSTPDRAWFAVWDGHGFVNWATRLAHPGPLDDDARRALDDERRALRDEDRREQASIRAELDRILRFDLPHRSYYLLGGPVAAVADIRYPGFDRWGNPDLFWPDDRGWFVATDVDFWSLYVGGTHDFTGELADCVPTRSELVDLDRRLELEE